MSCPIEDIREYDIQRLLSYVTSNSATYQEWSDRYLAATSATSATIINNAIGSAASFASVVNNTLQINGNVQATGNIQANSNLLTPYVLTSSINYNVANQNNPYLIAGTPSYTGATTNWGTYGMQHRFKTDASSNPRITVDSNTQELFTIENSGDIGIGISNPVTKLHVNGGTQVEGRITLKPALNTTPVSVTTNLTSGTSPAPALAGYFEVTINSTNYKIPYYL